LKREIQRAALSDSLRAIRDFIQDSCRDAGVGRRETHGLVVAVDEACNNVVEHGYQGRPPGSIAVSFDVRDGRVVVAITDRGRAFDPGDAPAPELHSDWRNRKVGGLGWHLIRQFVDEIHYKPDAEKGNELTLIKKIGREGE